MHWSDLDALLACSVVSSRGGRCASAVPGDLTALLSPRLWGLGLCFPLLAAGARGRDPWTTGNSWRWAPPRPQGWGARGSGPPGETANSICLEGRTVEVNTRLPTIAMPRYLARTSTRFYDWRTELKVQNIIETCASPNNLKTEAAVLSTVL